MAVLERSGVGSHPLTQSCEILDSMQINYPAQAPWERINANRPPRGDGIFEGDLRRDGYEVAVTPGKDGMCNCHVQAIIDMPPEEVFEVSSSTASKARVFRGILDVNSIEVLSDDGNRQQVQEDLTLAARVMKMKKRSTQVVKYTHDRNALHTTFELVRAGAMTHLDGYWKMQAISPEQASFVEASNSLDGTRSKELTKKNGTKQRACTFLEIEQRIQVEIPRLSRALVRRSAAWLLRTHVEDLRAVAALRKAGVTIAEILQEHVHGRKGLTQRILGKRLDQDD